MSPTQCTAPAHPFVPPLLTHDARNMHNARYVIDLYEAEVPLKYRREICEEPMRRAQVEVRLVSRSALLLLCLVARGPI